MALGCGEAKAQDGHLVYLPMIFHTEAQDIRTAACLQVKEHVYSDTHWWENSAGVNSASERAFKAVLVAMQRKDRDALLNLSDLAETKDTKSFDQQANAFFRQFENLELLEVPRSYDFDELAIFFMKLRSRNGSLFAPLLFAHKDDGSFRFLPQRTRRVTYPVVEDWFDSRWGPAKSSQPTYCTDDEIRRDTHEVTLVYSGKTNSWNPSRIFLKGASFDAPGELSDLIARMRSKIGEMKVALENSRIDDFVRNLTPEGANRLREWFTSADEQARVEYKKAVIDEQPLFLFDLISLIVLYVKSPTGDIHVMYFTFSAKNDLLWTNSSHVTIADEIFKKGPLYNTALSAKPFSGITKK